MQEGEGIVLLDSNNRLSELMILMIWFTRNSLDSYERYNSSALSAASFGRNVFGAFLPLASQRLYSNLGKSKIFSSPK